MLSILAFADNADASSPDGDHLSFTAWICFFGMVSYILQQCASDIAYDRRVAEKDRSKEAVWCAGSVVTLVFEIDGLVLGSWATPLDVKSD